MRSWSAPSATSWRLAAALLEWRTRRARREPDAFAEFAFRDPEGRPLVQATVHRELQCFLGAHDRALVELPRDHGKTAQLCVRVLWELGRRPALRVKVVCATAALAAERGRFLRDAVADNERVRLVFPHLVPAEPWAAERFTVRRPAEVIGPSVTALGVGAGSTGARADLLVCDDVVDVRAVRGRADRERVKVFFRDNLVNLLEPDGRLWALFTPWHGDDLNAELKKNPAYAHFRRAIGENLEPVWPEKWPRERLEERRREVGELAFARGYRLVCLGDADVLIRPEWVRFWELRSAVAGVCDPGRPASQRPATDGPASQGPATDGRPASQGPTTEGPGSQTPATDGGSATETEFIVLAVDPAVSAKHTADASALVTLALGADGTVRCLEALARRVPMPELIGLIAEADRRWRPDVIVLEANAAFQGLYDLLARKAPFGGKLVPHKQANDKATRVQIFSAAVQNGRFLLRGTGGAPDPGQQELYDEMTTFPVGEHDDLLDAAAMGTAYLLRSGGGRLAW